MNQNKIGEFIRNCRKDKNLTQEQLANLLFISPKTVSKWETGRGMPDSSLMIPLSKCLDISVNELLNGDHIINDNYREVAEETLIKLEKNKQKINRLLTIFEKSLYIVLLLFILMTIFVLFRFSPSLILIQFLTFGFICLSIIFIVVIVKHTKNNK